jgi:L-ascorbate metabolism protein UlaG (beta-lactamase superfamily)
VEQVYLRHNIQVEPLVDQWYVWSYLIPPATAARNLTERHVKIMQSYIAAPQVHANAIKNPKMGGGPFIDYNGRRVDEIDELLRRTLRDRRYLVALSTALQDLDKMLVTRAKGESMEGLYGLVPDALKGYVELVYDLNNNPSYRLLESLLYESQYYKVDSQSIALSETSGDDRPFFCSTPRLPTPGLLELSLPFADQGLDCLFAAKHTATSFGELAERCGVDASQQALFGSFVTAERPNAYIRYAGKGVRWRYFGHACILLETPTLSFLFDPALSYTYESQISRYTYDDLPEKIDYVLITHNHQDHLMFETMLQLRHKIGSIVVPRNGGGSLQDPSLKLTLQRVGFRNVVELDDMESLEFEGGSLTALPFMGEHADLNVRSKQACLLELSGHKLLFCADSCNVEPALYDHIHKLIGDVRAVFLGMECAGAPLSWLYGPLLTRPLDRAQDHSRRLSGSNYTQAMGIVNRMKCREVFVYAMGQEPWLHHVMSVKYTPESYPIAESNKVIEECRGRGMIAERLFGEREMLLD